MTTRFDKPQLKAIDHTSGPMLVIAGAGTGKTTVLAQRVARLVCDHHARPDEILAVTFTDNAAAKLRDRVQALLADTDCESLKACTFHAFGYKLLCEQGKKFEVLCKEDLWVFLRRNLAELKLERFTKAADPGEFLDHLLGFYDRCRDELVGPAEYAAYVAKVRSLELPPPRVGKSSEELSFDEIIARCDELARVYRKVDEMLATRGLGTFGDMITKAVALLQSDQESLTTAQAGARFILIDEFQDSNRAQIELAALLAGKDENVFAVGDPDQAIYRFRGASSGAFEQFLDRFPESEMVRLERNYRSTSSVLRCAFASISKNPDFAVVQSQGDELRRQVLVAAREENAAARPVPEPVSVVLSKSSIGEAYDVAVSIEERRERRHKLRWKDFAVLYRSHLHRGELVEELAAKGIPFVVAGLNVLETGPVRDLLAALRCVQSDFDGVSLFRIASNPQFKVDAHKFRTVCQRAERGTNLTDLLCGVEGGKAVLDTIQACREQAKNVPSVHALVPTVCQAFHLDLRARPLETFQKFIAGWEKKPITSTKSLKEFLEYMDLFEQAGGGIELPLPQDSEDAVTLYTIHAAKGLEFKCVYVLRVNSGSFPSNYREPLFAFPDALRNFPAPAEEDDRRLQSEEERRLFHVAVTRARDKLTVCARRGRGKDTTPAGYLRELMKDRTLNDVVKVQQAMPYQASLAAATQPLPPVAEWVYLPPAPSTGSLVLSATAIESYKQCPLQFKISRDWRLPAETTAALQFGSAMHTALKFYYDGVLQKKTPSQDQLLAKLAECLDGNAITDPLQRALYGKQGIAQLTAFLGSRQAASPATTLHTERSFKVKIGGVEVSGRIDRMDALEGIDPLSVAITDYKTGRPRNQDDADDNLQLSLYALAAERAWNFKAHRLAFHNLQDNSIVETSRTPAQLNEAEATVHEVAAKVQEGRFEAKPGRHCRWCGYRSICPAQERKLYDSTGDFQMMTAKVH